MLAYLSLKYLIQKHNEIEKSFHELSYNTSWKMVLITTISDTKI